MKRETTPAKVTDKIMELCGRYRAGISSCFGAGMEFAK